MKRIFHPICICVAGWMMSCSHPATMFEKINSSESGVTFINAIPENDSVNALDLVNVYNGGGVGIGDFNNDGLQDLYFTGNTVSSKLYLNKGGFRFTDVTDEAGVGGPGRWARGVAVVDINNDGLMDLYVCNTVHKDPMRLRNILYLNTGVDKNGCPRFRDAAAEYGLDIALQSTMATFFDYDNDGDLDMYLTVNSASSVENLYIFKPASQQLSSESAGKLFRNDFDSSLRHTVYHDVSVAAGIVIGGYGHGATVCDLNLDGWKDIYVTNDFLPNNILYVNNRDGSFTDRSSEYFKHTSYNAMGQDVVDISNDGLADVVELDMSPRDNYRRKMMLNANSNVTYQNFDFYKYQYQYVRNTLQLNLGPRVLQNDSIGAPVFGDIGFMSGIAQTDWSWTPVVTDFDNDGFRDIIVTNGFPKDVTDHDFIFYRDKVSAGTPKASILSQIPEVKLHNYAFRNNSAFGFSDVTVKWGLSTPSFSNGAVYSDLDNDGDMDMVISNINDQAFIYRNTTRDKPDTISNYLQIRFKGDAGNRNGLGAFATLFYDHGRQQVVENNPYRGYLSSMQSIAHFGLGRTSVVDSVVIRWIGNRKQVLRNVAVNQVLEVDASNATAADSWQQPILAASSIFTDITGSSGITYRHKDFDFIDFNIQSTLPHKLSEYCPALAAGDVDGNGLDDLVVGGNAVYHAQVLLQQPDGKFIQQEIPTGEPGKNAGFKDAGILLFDANGDGLDDLYIASGGYKAASGSTDYQDRFYLNAGQGKFRLQPGVLPVNHTSKMCVRSSDINGDGKPDLFVSGRVDPWKYPAPVSSFIFRNDSDKDHIRFTDITDEVAPGLRDIGLVCDAIFTDFDNDQETDLVLAGEWMPVTFLKNTKGRFTNVTPESGVGHLTGWWGSIVAGDFRHTGRIDYIVGNTGINSLYQPDEEYPVFITAKDFDKNGSFVAVPSLFLQDKDGGALKEFPAHGRDDIIERIPTMKKRFDQYQAFAKSTMSEIFTAAQFKDALRLRVNTSKSCFLRNDGNGRFTVLPLPDLAQVSVINGMVADDFDGDGNVDVLVNGNDYGTDVSVGRYDALNGLLLKGRGDGSFTPLSILESGIYIPGNGKALVKLRGSNGQYLIAASQNQAPLKLYELKRKQRIIQLDRDDVNALIHFTDGRIRLEEFYYGHSFISQSARFMAVPENVNSIVITKRNGVGRHIR
ncbi:MAG: RNA-binding protein [Chitinophagaceae bacterium]|nr:MAG: RNA-binding protein [Chitinophagaceae bacterium]